MSDNDEQDRPEEPNADPLLLMTDIKRSGVIPFLGTAMRASVMGSTNFEGMDLEEMRALVDNANHGDIESAADALWKAGGKIREVGDDLRKHIDKVDWEGEFGDSFRAWGRDLSKNTILLADYTEQASIHLKAAGAGLAQVQGSMPKYDARTAAAPRLEDVPVVERVEGNEKYQLAKKKEEDRQEAINQMNRLTSYYRVSHENMQSKEEPKFGPMPNIGMPPAPPRAPEDSSPGMRSAVPAEAYRTAEPLPQAEERGVEVRGTSPNGGANTSTASDGRIEPEREVRTDLNRVASPAAPPADSGPRAQPPVNSGTTSPTTIPIAPAPFSPHNGARNGRLGGAHVPSNPNPGQHGRGQGRVGNAPAVPPANNAATRPIAGAGGTPVGRNPNAMTPPVGRGNNGIIGGTPRQSGTAVNKPHISRGAVVGGEHGAMGRPPVGSGGTGALGTGTGSGSPGRRPGSNPNGITGTPRSIPTQGAAPRPFTPGGTGLTRSGTTSGNQNSMGVAPRTGTAGSRDESRNESRRPEYLTEDEETWRAGRNGIAPPVVD